jgi:hypothetical protein
MNPGAEYSVVPERVKQWPFTPVFDEFVKTHLMQDRAMLIRMGRLDLYPHACI